jgi:hypothetical protein
MKSSLLILILIFLFSNGIPTKDPVLVYGTHYVNNQPVSIEMHAGKISKIANLLFSYGDHPRIFKDEGKSFGLGRSQKRP